MAIFPLGGLAKNGHFWGYVTPHVFQFLTGKFPIKKKKKMYGILCGHFPGEIVGSFRYILYIFLYNGNPGENPIPSKFPVENIKIRFPLRPTENPHKIGSFRITCRTFYVKSILLNIKNVGMLCGF